MRAAIYSDNSCSSEVEGFSVDSVICIDKARVIGAPVETGAISFDNKVIDPYEVIVKGHIVDAGVFGDNSFHDSVDAKNTIYEMFLTREFKFFSVSDNADEYIDLIMTNVKQEKSSSHPDWRAYEIRYVQAMKIQANNSASPKNPENTNTRKTGTASLITIR